MAVKSKYDYTPADTSFRINELDPDRKTIEISLPNPPPIELIDGYGLSSEEQCFKRMKVPKRILLLETEVLRELQDIKKENRQESITGYKIIEKFWEKIEDRADDYEKEIEYIKHVWWYRVNGYWFFNDGKPTYITGRHFMFLNFFTMPDVRDNEGKPEYRDRHRREFLFRDYLRVAHHTFAKRDEKGWAIAEEDGHYEMKDMGIRLFYGDIHPKSRRNGSSIMGINDMIEGAELGFGRYSTIISKDGDSTEEHYTLRLLPTWGSRPFFLKPLWNGTSAPTQIKYFPPRNSFLTEGLMSVIDYTASAGVVKKDGSKLNGFIVFDEEGKCFHPDTEILIYKGGVKKIKDIVAGDLLVGDNGLPCKVLKLYKGKGQLYKVVPRKGDPWICNDNHILVAKNCDSFIGSKKGDIIEIRVKDYLHLSKWNKRSLVLYKHDVEYEEQPHKIEPYLLGAWLGDGHSGGAYITNIDKEIINYLHTVSRNHGWKVTCGKNKGITYAISPSIWYAYPDKNGQVEIFDTKNQIRAKYGNIYLGNIKRTSNIPFSTLLKEEGVINNKHIPQSFLYDSRDNRLQLLAGLIDTDGYAYKNPRLMYEIIQVRKDLAFQIQDLARGLGFYTSINFKKTSYRLNGKLVKCNGAWRIKIHGKNLYEIPCKVKRKVYKKKELHINTREPLHTGFRVEEYGIGDFCGFAIEGNGRFLLGDYTVVHNTEAETNVLQRWDVYKNAMALGDGTKIIGNCTHISTVEEINASGKAFLDMLELSDFYQRGDNGQTSAGLGAQVHPAYDGLEGFIDFHGMSVINEPTEKQMEMRPDGQFKILGKGAYQYQQEKRDDFIKKGTPAAMQSYRAYIKKYPWRSSELTIGTSGDIGFSYEIIDKRMAELRKLRSLGRLDIEIGNFYRQNNNLEGLVYWRTEENGKFEMSMEMPPEQTNLKKRTMGFDIEKNKYVPMFEPVYKSRFVCGADPFEYSNQKADTGVSKQSDGGIAVLWEHDVTIDKSENPYDWESRTFVVSYRYRPASLQEYNEDVLMVCEYYGAMVFMERNKTSTWEYFIRRGRGGYLKHEQDLTTGKLADKPGFYSQSASKDELFAEIKDYITFRGHQEEHLPFLEECRNIRSKDEMTKYDRLTAHGAALLGSRSSHGKAQDIFDTQKIDLGDCKWLNM